jgi:hypothetical protein
MADGITRLTKPRKLSAGPLCRHCGKPIAKMTGVLRFGATSDQDYGAYWTDSTARPRNKAEAQTLTNLQILRYTTVGDPDGTGFFAKASTWDGESYRDQFFCKDECAIDFARLMAKAGHGTNLYVEAKARQTPSSLSELTPRAQVGNGRS